MEQNITMLNPKWRKDMFFCSMIKHVLVVYLKRLRRGKQFLIH
jgi:hypothetical protein